MLKHIFTAVALIYLLVGQANSQEDKPHRVATVGAGVNQSCGQWLRVRASADFNSYFNMSNWALGFLSAAAIFGEELNPLHDVDADALDYWLDNYCRKRPTARFIDALKEFVREHPR